MLPGGNTTRKTNPTSTSTSVQTTTTPSRAGSNATPIAGEHPSRPGRRPRRPRRKPRRPPGGGKRGKASSRGLGTKSRRTNTAPSKAQSRTCSSRQNQGGSFRTLLPLPSYVRLRTHRPQFRNSVLRDSASIQRGIIRHVYLVIDLSSAMLVRDYKATWLDLTLQYAQVRAKLSPWFCSDS